MTTTTWETSGTDAARDHAEATGRAVIAVSDGQLGYWRELGAGETPEAALGEFRAGYEGATGDPVEGFEVYGRAAVRYAIQSHGTRDGKKYTDRDDRTYATREEAEAVIEAREAEGANNPHTEVVEIDE